MIAALLWTVLLESISTAVPISELSEQVSRTLQGGIGEEQEQRLIGSLADLSVDLANRYDQWVRTGSAEARASAASLADALLPLLERLHAYHQGRIDKAQNEIIAADGNPEVLYEQKSWQVDRGFALATLGQLTWVYYRTVMLHPEAKEANAIRLKKAIEGFSEFVFSPDARLRDESLLGRALAERERGETDAAAGDLKAVLDRGKDSPLYWPARLTLAEVKVAAGDVGEALAEAQRLMSEASSSGVAMETLNQARLLRFQALAVASKKGASQSLHQEALGLSRELSQLGPIWSKRVHEIALATMADPRPILGATASAEWIAAENLASQEKFKEASAAYEAVLASTDPAAREHWKEAHHRLGVCYFRLGRYADSEREFRIFLSSAPDSPLSAEAAYLRFRSAEGIYRQRPASDTRELFRSAVETYVKGFPKHENAYEGAFRFAEILQGERQFSEAAEAYSRVTGPASFEIRAATGEIQCLADLLLNPPQDADKTWAKRLRERALKTYRRFEQMTARESGGRAIVDLRARTLLAKAMVESGGPEPRLVDALNTLRDFENKYSDLPDLHPLAAALRLSAQTSLGRLEEAERSLSDLLQAKNLGSTEVLERIARGFLRRSAENAGENQRDSDRWAKLAAVTFDRLKAAGRPIPEDVKASLAQLYAEQGRLDDAASLYVALTREFPQSRSILRNAAMVADRRAAHAEAAELWQRLAVLQELATPAWYEARLQAARAWMASGQAEKSCTSLREVDEFRPDLRDVATKKRFAEIAAQACRQAGS